MHRRRASACAGAFRRFPVAARRPCVLARGAARPLAVRCPGCVSDPRRRGAGRRACAGAPRRGGHPDRARRPPPVAGGRCRARRSLAGHPRLLAAAGLRARVRRREGRRHRDRMGRETGAVAGRRGAQDAGAVQALRLHLRGPGSVPDPRGAQRGPGGDGDPRDPPGRPRSGAGRQLRVGPASVRSRSRGGDARAPHALPRARRRTGRHTRTGRRRGRAPPPSRG